MVRLAIGLAIALVLAGPRPPAAAQGQLLGQEKRVLNMTKGSWAHFRNYEGRQLIYFTHLETMRCGISDVRYSLNGDALDRVWWLQPCDPLKPHHVTTTKPYIVLPLGTAAQVSVQLTFADGTRSEIVRISSANQLLQ